MIRAFLVDDEPLARDELSFLLGQCAGLEIVGEAENARDTLSWFEHQAADIVFVDLHMPGPDGLALCSRLKQMQPAPRVVIVSAHEESAARAFEAGASDYLLKPVRLVRLQQCLQRLPPTTAAGNDAGATRVAIRRGESYTIINLEDALFFEIGSEGLVMVGPHARHLLDLTLADVEQRLGAHGKFFRCHRSALVRVDAITSFEMQSSGTGMLNVSSAHTLPVARERMRELRQLIPVAG